MNTCRRVGVALSCWLIACALPALLTARPAERAAERAEMVGSIAGMVQETASYLGKAQLDQRVLDVMRSVPRHVFVPDAQQAHAYENRPLPIGYGQSISQPYIVALMTDLLQVGPGDSVLEIGTGSGYQAAVLAGLVGQVSSIEIVPELGERARTTLQQLDCDNVDVRIGDGYYGWEERAPFDAIIVTAAASHVPPPLVRQLRPGGRMLVPVGSRFLVQELLLVEKADDGAVSTRQILPVTFVPLTGGH